MHFVMTGAAQHQQHKCFVQMFMFYIQSCILLYCSDTVGWVIGRASGL